MAEFQASPGQTQRPSSRTTITTTTATNNPTPASATSSFLHRMHENVSTQVHGIFSLVISGGILVLLTGLTLTVVVLAIFFTPLVVISSPIWFPIGFVLFLMTAGFLSFCSFGVAAMATMLLLYRYFRALQHPDSDWFDYAVIRLSDTDTHVKDYAREYGGYLHSKVKDAAPGAGA